MVSAVWFNGEFVEGPLRLDPAERGLALGDGVFETIAVFNGQAVWLEAHLDRLGRGADVLGIALARSDIEAGVAAVLGRAGHGILRITLTRGPGGRRLAGAPGGRPSLLVTLAAWQTGVLFQPARLITASVRRNEHSPAARLKTLSYLDNILAAREAQAQGADEALMLNSQGRVACATIANLVVLEGDDLATPPQGEGALPGITAGRLALARRPVEPAALFEADGAFLTNSIRLIRPIVALDGRPLAQRAEGRVKALFDGLCRSIAAEAGIDPRAVDRV